MEHLFQRRPGWVKGYVQYQRGGGESEDPVTAGSRSGGLCGQPGRPDCM
jgi:hypothetical protein